VTPARLKEIEEAAIAGRMPDSLTIQALVATIRIQDRAIEEQRQVIVTLREQIRAVQP
jgi:hypothetical protein